MAEYSRLPSRGRSLIAESVETGGRMQGVTGVSRDTYPRPLAYRTASFHYCIDAKGTYGPLPSY